jgi:ADP-heptose:LPS heptosyltransferase
MKVKFLIIRFSSIGDIVLTTPIIRCLKQQVEGAEIHYATKKQFATIVNANPYVDKVHVLDEKLNDLIKELRKEDFDYIIDLHHNLRSSIVKAKLKTLSFAFNKINFQKWLMVTFKINKLPKQHIVDRYLETCKIFGVVNDNKGLDFFIETKNEVNLETLSSVFKNGYAAIVIGAKHNTKQLPVEKMVLLCKEINFPVVLLGGNEDRENAEVIIEKSGKSEILSACGNYNLQQSASLIKQANVVITHDTGLMHIAAAFNQKIISIWGNTIPEFGMYPYMPGQEHFMFEVKNLKCRPCSKIGYQKCPKGHFNCMNKQDLKGIAKKCNELFT